MEQITTIKEVLQSIASGKQNPEALSYQNEEGGWESLSTQEFLDEVKFLALGLQNIGLRPGEKVGILAASSPRWSIADLAVIAARGVNVPLFSNISDENFDFEVMQTELKCLFVAGEEQWEMLGRHRDRFETVISLYDEPSDHMVFRYSEIIEQGRAVDEKDPGLFGKLLDEAKPDDLGSIIYTSGSTGVPKGVMLNQRNLYGLVHADPFHWKEDDTYLSLLPLAHIFARMLNTIFIVWGISIYYIRDIKTVADACKELHPRLIVLVPRLLEKIYAKMVAKMEASSFLKRAIGSWAFRLANDEKKGVFKKLLMPVADLLVYKKLRAALGGNLRLVISGGAALNPHLNHFFREIGIPLVEGWGLTEAAPITTNRIEWVKIGTVGPPIEGMEVKIGENGEVMAKGVLVMQGYYKNEEATLETLTKDGWLKTGDKGTIDDDGFLTIEGRLKELYKSSTGEYIAPVPIEQQLCKAPLIDMAMVIADNRKFASCLLFPDMEVVNQLKEVHGGPQMSVGEFLNSGFVKKEMERLLKNVNSHLNHWEEIHAYRFIPHTPTIKGGELTPTMKIRREKVLEKYKHLVEEMYAEETNE